MRLAINTFILVLLAFNPVNAEDRFPTQRSSELQWGLGLGALIEDEGYRNIGSETNGTPVLYVSNDYFRFFANQFDVSIYGTEQFSLSGKAESRMDGFSPDDNAYYAGMEERDGAIFAGFRGEYKTDAGNLVAEWVTDVTGDSNGSYGSLGAYWHVDRGASQLVPKVAVEYYDSDYTDYYYGVRAGEARSDRPAYIADAVFNLDLGVDFIYRFNRHHQLISSAKYRRFGSSVTDSPLVDKSGSARFVVGYLYVF